MPASGLPDTARDYNVPRPTIAQVRDAYPLYAAHGWYLTPLLRIAADRRV